MDQIVFIYVLWHLIINILLMIQVLYLLNITLYFKLFRNEISMYILFQHPIFITDIIFDVIPIQQVTHSTRVLTPFHTRTPIHFIGIQPYKITRWDVNLLPIQIIGKLSIVGVSSGFTIGKNELILTT